MKVSKTKKGISIDGNYIGNSTFDVEKKLVNTILDGGKRSLTRDNWVKETSLELDIDINQLKEILKDVIEVNITQEELDKSIKNTCPECYTGGRSNKWGNKAIANFLNDILNTKIFTF